MKCFSTPGNLKTIICENYVKIYQKMTICTSCSMPMMGGGSIKGKKEKACNKCKGACTCTCKCKVKGLCKKKTSAKTSTKTSAKTSTNGEK